MLKEMLSEPFMQRALTLALLMGPFCALMGVFVTARKLSFFSETLAHSSLTGVALGFWWGLSDPTLTQILFSVFIAFGVIWLKENTKLLTDAIMAVVLSGSVAAGVVILSLMKGYRGELHRYLFGDILATGSVQVVAGGIIVVLGTLFLFSKMRSLTLLTLNEELAKVSGVRVRGLNYIFLLFLTLTNLAHNLRQHLMLGVCIGFFSSGLGVILSYYFDLPCGPVMALTSIVFFILSVLASLVLKVFKRSN